MYVTGISIEIQITANVNNTAIQSTQWMLVGYIEKKSKVKHIKELIEISNGTHIGIVTTVYSNCYVF